MQLALLTPTSKGYPAHLIEALRQRRLSMRLALHDVAARIPGSAPGNVLHISALSGWERRETTPPPHMLAAWAAALGVQVVVGLQEVPDPKAKPR